MFSTLARLRPVSLIDVVAGVLTAATANVFNEII